MASRREEQDKALGPQAELGLTSQELAEIREAAFAQVRTEQLKALKEAEMDRALRAARIEAGVARAADIEQPTVEVKLDLPDNITPIPALIISGKKYYDQTVYYVTPSVARDLLSMEQMAQNNAAREKGKWKDPRRQRRSQVSANGVTNAPRLVGGYENAFG